jgi:hypothetical protein
MAPRRTLLMAPHEVPFKAPLLPANRESIL